MARGVSSAVFLNLAQRRGDAEFFLILLCVSAALREVVFFKPPLRYKDGATKGNCDAELVLYAMIEFPNYDRALIVSGDGDFQCLAKYLHEQGKLAALMVPNRGKYSALLKHKIFTPYLRFVSDLRAKLEYRAG